MLRRALPIVALVCAIMLALTLHARRGRDAGAEADPATTTVAASPPAHRTIPVLCYHSIIANPSSSYSVPTADFKAQMGVLAEEGYTPITCTQLADYLDGTLELPEKPVVITFDDGWVSNYEVAAPILDQLGFKATFFPMTGSVGTKNHMTYEQLKELADRGHEIGSHSINHPNLPKPDPGETLEAHQARIRSELVDSKQAIEQSTGKPVIALAYPHGTYDETVMAMTQDAGYRLAFSIDRGVADERAYRWRLPRDMVVKGNSLNTFRNWLHQEPLHIDDISPLIGQVARSAQIEYRGTLPDEDVDPAALVLAEKPAGQSADIRHDETTGQVVISTTLNEGANNIRVQSPGEVLRETSWVVFYRP